MSVESRAEQRGELGARGKNTQGSMTHEKELWFDSKGNGKAGIRIRFIALQIYSGCLVESRFGEI